MDWPKRDWPKSVPSVTVVARPFGQSNFGQSVFGQSFSVMCCCCDVLLLFCVLLLCVGVVCCCRVLLLGVVVGCWCWVLVWLFWTLRFPSAPNPPADPPALDHPTPDRPKFRSFFPLPPPVSLFLSLSLWVSSRGVFESRSPQMCTFGLSKRAHLRAPGASNTTKFPREDTQRETKKNENGRGRGATKREILGLPTLRGPTFSEFGPTPSGPAISPNQNRLTRPPTQGAFSEISDCPNQIGPKSARAFVSVSRPGLTRSGLTGQGPTRKQKRA